MDCNSILRLVRPAVISLTISLRLTRMFQIQGVPGIRRNITNMSNYSRESYIQMFDALLSEELYHNASAASETNIRHAMKRILGRAIKTNVIKLYSNLVLDENLNVHFAIVDGDGTRFELVLLYGA
jgi:hypothetical protein